MKKQSKPKEPNLSRIIYLFIRNKILELLALAAIPLTIYGFGKWNPFGFTIDTLGLNSVWYTGIASLLFSIFILIAVVLGLAILWIIIDANWSLAKKQARSIK